MNTSRWSQIFICVAVCSGPFVVKVGWAASIETGPTATQFGSACTQTMPRLLGACLRWANCFRWIATGRYDNNKIK